MAFMGRGERPSINNDVGGIQDNNMSGHMSGHRFYRDYWYYRRNYYRIPLDNTYVIMQMIATFIILIVGFISFLVTYKSTIVDPIESIKKLFINTHLITIGILLAITLIVNFFSKKVTAMVKVLSIICFISIISMVVFLGIKINLDTTYTKKEFEQFYIENNSNAYSNTKSKIDVGITGMSIKTEKEYYIDECMKLYNIFKTKTYGTLGIHFLLNVLLIYQILKISKTETKKDKFNKDDLILFDEEQNVKY